MAGLGSRFSSLGIKTPKPLLVVNGKTLIEHSIESLNIVGRYIYITKRYENSDHNDRLREIFERLTPGYIEILVDQIQYGAADSSLYAKEYINNDSPLIITNCDQLLRWDAEKFTNFVSLHNPDGVIATHSSDNPKHSYAAISDNKVTFVIEKNPISHDALIGLHYWKHGSDFVESAIDLVRNYRRLDMSEAYISTTYNFLIKNGKTILPWLLPDGAYIALGTPEDVGIYLLKEENS